MFVIKWKWKTRKTITGSPIPSYESLVSAKKNIDRKRKKTRKKVKNADRTETKLDAHHIVYNVKMLSQ